MTLVWKKKTCHVAPTPNNNGEWWMMKMMMMSGFLDGKSSKYRKYFSRFELWHFVMWDFYDLKPTLVSSFVFHVLGPRYFFRRSRWSGKDRPANIPTGLVLANLIARNTVKTIGQPNKFCKWKNDKCYIKSKRINKYKTKQTHDTCLQQLSSITTNRHTNYYRSKVLMSHCLCLGREINTKIFSRPGRRLTHNAESFYCLHV